MEDAADTAAKRAWTGNLNATHLLPCREDNKTQGYMEEMVLMGFDSSFFHDWGKTNGLAVAGGNDKTTLYRRLV